MVGRAGVEKQYDAWLRGMPGYTSVKVDSMGRAIGDDGELAAQPGDTLVTSIDAKVQGVVERQLAGTIRTARQTYDEVTHRNYRADSGAVVVLEADTGRIVAMASQPTYDPSVWVGGITKTQLAHLYSEKAGTPLLGRATQGQFAPGSTWKPIMATGALNNGFSAGHRAELLVRRCRSATGGSRTTSPRPTATSASTRRCSSRATRSSTGSGCTSGSATARTRPTSSAQGPARRAGQGLRLRQRHRRRPARRGGRPDRGPALEARVLEGDAQATTARIDRKGNGDRFLRVFAHEFCLEGNYYRAGDAVNYSIGQGDTIVTPLQLARAYAAFTNGGTLYAPRVAKAVVSPDGTVLKRFAPQVNGHVRASAATMRYVDTALLGTPKVGTLAWKFGDFPLDRVHIRGKTGSAEVYGKQSTSWVASYDENYVVVMMVSQAGTGSGTSGPAVRAIWETLYGVRGMTVDPRRAAIPGTTPPDGLPTFTDDGSILPPGAGPRVTLLNRRHASTGCSRPPCSALLTLSTLLVWSATSHRADLTGDDPTAYLRRQVVNIVIGLVLMTAVTLADHRWVRILAPVVYLASVAGLVLVLTNGATINGSQSWLRVAGMSVQPSEFAKLAVVIGMALVLAERVQGRLAADGRPDRGRADAADRRRAGGADPGPARPRDDAGAVGDGLRGARGLRRPARWLVLVVAGAAAAAYAAFSAGVLKAYQVDRFLAFVDPTLDPRGAGYNVEQARIAVGNGGLFGQGLFDGSQTQAGFVPEQHTDFVFTVAGEELGLVGAGC